MTDKGILKQIMPYLLVFTCALGYAGVEFTRQISAPASADASNITVNISPVSTEAKEGDEWSWSVSTFVDSYFKDPFQLEYLIDWCNSDISGGADTKTCAEEFMNGRYKQTLTKGVIDVKTRDSVQAIRHESIPCGSAKITVRRGTEVVGYREVDTEIACQTLGIAGFEDPAQGEGLPSDNIVEIINDLFSIGKDASDELNEEESEHAPAIPAPQPPPGSGTPGAPPGAGTPGAPPGGSAGGTGVCQSPDPIFVPGTSYQPGTVRNKCMRPTRIFIHWSGSWTSAEATLDLMNRRGLSCQLATDDSHSLQLLDFFGTQAEHAWCVGGDANTGSLNIEISGAYFDEIVNNPSSSRYNQLMASTRKAVSLTCWMLNKYGIDKNNGIYGHFQFTTNDKRDPGPKYLEFFKQEVKKAC